MDTIESEKNRPFRLFAMREDNVDSLLTPWSSVHFLSGAAMKAIVSFSMNFLIHAVYELKDVLKQDQVYNSAINSVGDQFASMGGHYVANKGQTTWVALWLIMFATAVYTGNEWG